MANEGNIRNLASGAFEAATTTRKNNLKQVGSVFKTLITNPKEAIKQGLEREKLLLRQISLETGRDVSKGEIIKNGLNVGAYSLGKTLSDPVKSKELYINASGFVASKLGASTGLPGAGLAGDLIGARTARRMFDDKDILKEALGKLQGDSVYNESNRLGKISLIFSESKKIKSNKIFEDKINIISDTSGWAVGNFAADQLSKISSVPLKGALPGIVAGELSANIARLSPPKSFLEAASEVIGGSIKKGDIREQELRSKLTSNWKLIKQYKES